MPDDVITQQDQTEGEDSPQAPDVKNLLSALNHERDNRRKARQELAAMRDQVSGLDLDLARDLIQRHENEQRAKLDVDAQVNERIAGHLKQKDQTIKDLESKVGGLENTIKEMFFQGEVARVARDQNFLEEAIELVVDRAQRVFRLEDGNYVPYDNDKILYGSDNTSPMTTKEFIADLAKSMPFLCQGSTKGGALLRPNGAEPGSAGQPDFSKMTASDLLRAGRQRRA